ncbi:hypothetical protein Hanom_Chr04g00303971 [Helianthus anomalus]
MGSIWLVKGLEIKCWICYKRKWCGKGLNKYIKLDRELVFSKWCCIELRWNRGVFKCTKVTACIVSGCGILAQYYEMCWSPVDGMLIMGVLVIGIFRLALGCVITDDYKRGLVGPLNVEDNLGNDEWADGLKLERDGFVYYVWTNWAWWLFGWASKAKRMNIWVDMLKWAGFKWGELDIDWNIWMEAGMSGKKCDVGLKNWAAGIGLGMDLCDGPLLAFRF